MIMMRRPDHLAPFLLVSLLATVHLAGPVGAAKFVCNAGDSGGTSKCQSLIGYTAGNATTLNGVMSLFGIHSLRSLLGANGLPLSTPPSRPVPAGATVRVRLDCACSTGYGASSRHPVYRVRHGVTLDAIARDVFGGLVTDKEIAAASNISDPGSVQGGQDIYIPLPCSCDEVGSEAVVHYAHVAAAGSSVSEIAAEFGTTEETLVKLNGISDPKSLEAGQVLDVPLRACSSSISNVSMDHGLHVPNGSYILTAGNCVICSCSSSSWQLDCYPTKGISTSVCPIATCGDLSLGNSSPSSACESTICAYAGYTDSNGSLNILTNLTTQSSCDNNAGEQQSQASDGSYLLPSGMQWAYVVAISISISINRRLLDFLLRG
ncbi:chitin elicitor-binding protein [Canna indica]|uniref:Chitin elicitor-binding protein n=1 Tax=Canna indica TaxID=4628 RepID=A0AAQ3JUN0_9LILI|nr:chitin elicitor-binding protein [Canna indica]